MADKGTVDALTLKDKVVSGVLFPLFGNTACHYTLPRTDMGSAY